VQYLVKLHLSLTSNLQSNYKVTEALSVPIWHHLKAELGKSRSPEKGRV